MGKGDETRAKMIDACAELLQKSGYRAASFGQMIRQSGAPRGSIYHHFPGGKDELVQAALLESGARWREHLESVVEGAPDLSQALERLTQALAEALVESGFTQGCPVATVALEVASEVPAVREACADHFRHNEALIARRGEEAGLPRETARPMATLVLSALEGALLLSRVYQDVTPLLTLGRTLGPLLQAAADPTSGGPERS